MARARILIVDDEATLRTVLSAVLSDAGYEVVACGSAEEARERLRTSPCDLIVVDKNLPAENGIDLTREVRRRERSPRVLMVTGYPSASSLVEAVNAGVEGYLVKPFTSLQHVLTAVQQLLASTRRQTSLPLQTLSALLTAGSTDAPPRAVVVAGSARLGERVRAALGAHARDFPSIELGVVAAMDQPEVVAADDLAALERLLHQAPRACTLYFGPTPGLGDAPRLFALSPLYIADPQTLPPAAGGGAP